MKKLILSVALVASVMMMASCSAEKKAEDKGEALKAKIENCSNSDSLAMYVQQAREYADELIKDGKDSAAETFLNEVIPAVKAKDTTGAIELSGLDLKAKADSAVEATKEAAKESAEKAKDAASDAVDKATDKANDAVDAAKQKAADAAQAGADKVKDILGK